MRAEDSLLAILGLKLSSVFLVLCRPQRSLSWQVTVGRGRAERAQLWGEHFVLQ